MYGGTGGRDRSRTRARDGRPGTGRLPAASGGRSVAALLTDLQTLYREAEKATERYNATEEALAEQRAETARLDRALARTRLSLHDSRGAAGRLARQQYQSVTGLSPTCGCCWRATRSGRWNKGM